VLGKGFFSLIRAPLFKKGIIKFDMVEVRLFSVAFLLLLGVQTTLLAQRPPKVQLNPVALGLDLPESYKNRTFIKGLAGFVNNIDQLVGSMIVIEGTKTSVITRFVKEDKPPVVTTTTSDVLFNAKIDHRFKQNGAYSIASTKIERDAVYEVVITDIGVAFLPEDYIPYLEICNASKNVSADLRRRMYYVRSAKLTTVYTRAFKKVMGSGSVSGLVFSAGGEVFSSTEQFNVDYIVSVDLVNLDKLLALQDCSQLQLKVERELREQAEQARLAASKAEEERKAREHDLAAVRSQLEDLYCLLGESLEQNAKIQKQMQEVKAREEEARRQLEEAQRQAELLTTKAAVEVKEAENAEKVIVTVRNKDGQVLEIKSLEELSKEKLQEMGFDLEILKPKGDEY
jgi:hypothetical protein